jgi:hypothetical protein
MPGGGQRQFTGRTARNKSKDGPWPEDSEFLLSDDKITGGLMSYS